MFESLFIVLVVMLLLLSTADLFVGVSNDAANFLAASVGTRIAPLTVIMLVASLGVLLGATFSSGMMEIARKGMFHPDMFTYQEIMFIFAAVMVSDVLLLNTFISFGLPTSTTVSVIFELLGASTMVSIYKIHAQGLGMGELFDFIKIDRAATIVTGILLSVVLAFLSGLMVQFVCRVFFTFRLRHTVKYVGGLFTGVCVTTIAYFLLVKGARGASFVTPQMLSYLEENLQIIMWGIFIVFFCLGQLMALAGLNIFKLIILMGTFGLAFSFAGNDLVNFVGVPLAALDGYGIWAESQQAATFFKMSALNEVARTNTIWLFLAGCVMCVTLWTSKKARRVVQTTVNLSSSSGGEREQFGASTMGRIITRMGLGVSRAVYHAMPAALLSGVGQRYRKAKVVKGQTPMPFDYVRASVNLVVASALISFATSLKLPLSTTYVTFMVAMGSSFADGAWDRESAVYRISGVITVIAGWFMTALGAFTLSCFIAFIICTFEGAALFTLVPGAFTLVIYSNFIRKNKKERAASILKAQNDAEILSSVSNAVPEYFEQQIACLKRSFDAFFEDNEFQLRKARIKAANIQEAITEQRGAYYTLALDQVGGNSRKDHGTVDAKFFFYLVYSNMLESAKSVRYSLDQAVNHVANRHTIFGGEMKQSLTELLKRLERLQLDMRQVAEKPDARNVENLVKHTKKLNRDIDRCQIGLVTIIGKQRVSMHSSEMYLTFLQALRDLANRFVAVGMQERALAELVEGNCVMTPVDDAQLSSDVLPAALNSNSESLVEQAVAEDQTESPLPGVSKASEAHTLPKSPAELEALEQSAVKDLKAQQGRGG